MWCAALAGCATGAPEPQPEPLTFLGEALIPSQPAIADDPRVGGLSSILHVRNDLYYAISDDRGEFGPARYYVLRIDLSDGRLEDGDAVIAEWRELTDAAGAPFARGTVDLEGMVAVNGALFVSSEGAASAGVEPFVAVFGEDGRMIETLGLPAGFAVTSDRSSGVRDNLAFESLAITPDDDFLFTGTESALLQDGPVATPGAGTLSRILRFDRRHGVFDAQFAYALESVFAVSPLSGAIQVNGLTELLALSHDHLLSLERAFVAGSFPAQSIKLFEVCLTGATNIAQIDSLSTTTETVVPASKRLIADLADLVPRLDNVEGMTFGPMLDGQRTLIFVSDDNFAPDRQVTQVLAFALSDDAIRGCDEQ